VPLWNSLPGEIKSSLSIQSLKRKLYIITTLKKLMHVLMLIGQGLGKRFALNVVLVLCLVVRRSACYEFLYECNYV
jgi:hypothetical protein